MSLAATALVARRVGEKNYGEAAHAGMQAILLAVIISIILAVLGVTFSEAILKLMGATPQMIAEMKDAYHIGDLKKVGAIAHKIKPSIDNLNIMALKDLIRDIEQAGKDELSEPRLPEMLSEADQILNEVVNANER